MTSQSQRLHELADELVLCHVLLLQEGYGYRYDHRHMPRKVREIADELHAIADTLEAKDTITLHTITAYAEAEVST